MKYITLLIILLLSFSFVAADSCNTYCKAENYESGTCRSANEDTGLFCQADETIYGTFEQCTQGSFERCCCSGEILETQETTENTSETAEIDQATQCKLVEFKVEKEDLPQIIFFELLLLVVILIIVVAFRSPKSHEFE